MAPCTCIPSILLLVVIHLAIGQNFEEICTDTRIMHKFNVVDFDWPHEMVRESAIDTEEYIPENNIIVGLKVYNDDVYVTVPRWRLGVPSTLNKVVVKNGTSVLKPFPSWEMQEIGDCRAFQYVESMEIDPNTGWMWIIDTGRINFLSTDCSETENICPAKIVVYDINNMEEVTRYEFPNEIVNRDTNYLNDLVVQYSMGEPRYAYITDTLNFRLVVYDRIQNTSHFYTHSSMLPEPGNGNISISGETLAVSVGINGIALSDDMKYLYYGPMTGYAIYQVPTSVVSSPGGDISTSVRKIGDKPSQTDGMVYSKKQHLYFASLTENALYRWNIDFDKTRQDANTGNVEMRTLTKVMFDNSCMNFVEIFNFDSYGYLWFTVNKLHKFHLNTMDFTGSSGPNVLIWKVFMDDLGYLDLRNETQTPVPSSTEDTPTGSGIINHVPNTIFLVTSVFAIYFFST